MTLLWMAIGRSVGTAAVATNVPPAGQQSTISSRAAELEAAEQKGSSACHRPPGDMTGVNYTITSHSHPDTRHCTPMSSKVNSDNDGTNSD